MVHLVGPCQYFVGEQGNDDATFVAQDHLELGVQFASRFGDEAVLIRLAAKLEEAMPWSHRVPPTHVSKAELVVCEEPGRV
jgi:hypothetical protein